MSKKPIRRPPRKPPLAALIGSVAKAPAGKKPKKKRLRVAVGDLVAYHAVQQHIQGSVGEVTAIIDRDRVIVKSFATQYESYEGHEWVALTYRPQGTTPDGEDKADYRTHLTKIVYRVAPQPPAPSKTKKTKPVTVLQGQDALLAHLAEGEHNPKADVVYIPDGTQESA